MTARREEETPRSAPEAMPEELSPRHLLRRLVGLAIFVGLVAVAIGSLPGLGEVRQRFADVNPWLLVCIGLLKLGSCLSNVVAFLEVFYRTMGWRFSYELGMAEQATNVLLPTGGAGGLALGAWALRQGGMSTAHIARRSVAFFVLTSIPNFLFAGVLGPLLLTGLFAGDVPTAPTVVFAALAWIVAGVTVVLPRVLARLGAGQRHSAVVGRLRRVALSFEAGLHDVGELIVHRRWPALLGACGYLGFDIAALVVGFAAFGGGVPLAPLIFGYVIGQLGGLIPLPAGIGGTDGGLIGAMVLYGAPLSQAAAAVLAYRTFQLGVPAIGGAIAFFSLRRTLARSTAPAAACAPLGDAPTT